MSEERQTEYTIAEGYELPSKGKIYSRDVNPHVELRSMTAYDELKRLSPSTTPLKTLSDIIEGCMIEKPAIHVYDMSLGDYEFLLHKLRVITYGGKYNMTISCPNCGEIVDTTTNLEDLKIKEFDEKEFSSHQTINLPKSKKTVVLNFTTPHILDDISLKSKEDRRRFKQTSIDFDTLEKIKFAIDTVNGSKLNDFELENFVKNLPAMDMIKILDAVDEMDSSIGVNNTIYVTCPKCGEEIKTSFRLNSEFFRPSDL